MQDGPESYKFFMRPDPNQRQFLGPIEQEDDPETGTVAMYRMARVGMVRGAKPESMPEVKVYLGFDGQMLLPHIRVDGAKPLQGWYQDKHNDKRGSRARPCFSEAVLTEPYGGFCTVGCAFCYINSGFRGYRGTGLITVPRNYGAQVARMLKNQRVSTAGYFSSFTDPFTVLEQIYHNTEQGARAFVDLGLPIFFLSRLSYPGWAFDLLKRSPFSYAQKSINTGNAEDYRKFSPAAIGLGQHLDEIRELRRHGIYTSIQVNPVVPGITSHEDIHELFIQLAAAGNNHVIVKFVEAGYSWAPAMVGRLNERFGAERASKFAALFTENQAGSQRTIWWNYREQAHRMYQRWATELGMTYSVCYEYRPGKDGEPKWTSFGPDITTSAQCHGQRVPMFTRRSSEEQFTPMTACAPSGCLYCEEHNGGRAACGDSQMGSALALRAPHFRRGIVRDPEATE